MFLYRDPLEGFLRFTEILSTTSQEQLHAKLLDLTERYFSHVVTFKSNFKSQIG